MSSSAKTEWPGHSGSEGVSSVEHVYILTYHGRTGKVVVSTDEPAPDCYYCKGIRGRGDAVNVQRYLHEGVGVFLR